MDARNASSKKKSSAKKVAIKNEMQQLEGAARGSNDILVAANQLKKLPNVVKF